MLWQPIYQHRVLSEEGLILIPVMGHLLPSQSGHNGGRLCLISSDILEDPLVQLVGEQGGFLKVIMVGIVYLDKTVKQITI